MLPVLLLLPACTTLGPWADTGPSDSAAPTERLVVSPGRLDFGSVSVNSDGYAASELTLYNLGSEQVTVTGHDEPVGSTAFSVAALPVIDLAPGAELVLEVRYTPTTEQSDLARLLIEPDGEAVELLGIGTAPVLDAASPMVDPVVLGCSGAGQVVVSNRGSEDLELTAATVDSAEFAVLSYPAGIPAGQSATIELGFTPGGGGPRGATLLVSSNDPASPIVGVPVSGLGYEGESVVETFRYTPSNPTDLLFVVTTGGEMESELDKAEAVLPLFVDTLRDNNIDYQLTALSSGAPCPASTPGWADRSDTALQATAVLERGFGGPSGPWDEDLLELAALALAQTGEGGCLDGFRRPDADLHVIVVSDGPSEGDLDAEALALAAYTESPGALHLSSLVPLTRGCGDLALDYSGLSESWSGTTHDLCAADWTEAFLDFASLPEGQTAVRYPLAEAPVAATLVVRAEGVTFPDWSFDAATNEVVFDGATVPALGAEITIEYVSAVACQ